MELQGLLNLFSTAKFPEEVFGDIKELELGKVHKKLLVSVHEDKFPKKSDKELARKASSLLSTWLQKAQEKFDNKTYGDRNALHIVLTSKLGSYVVQEKLAEGDIATIYRGIDTKSKVPLLVKVCRNPKNNDLLKNEATILKHLWNHPDVEEKLTLGFHIPKLLDSFELREGGKKVQVNILEFVPGVYTLAQVHTQHPNLDTRDLAWMLNRLISAMATAHEGGVCHGAIIPTNVLISPDDHNGMLIDWCYATLDKKPVKALVSNYKMLYAPEILSKKSATAATDIYMLGSLALYMMRKTDLDHADERFKSFFKTFLFANPIHRPESAWDVFDDFNELLRSLYGKRKFRQLFMQQPK